MKTVLSTALIAVATILSVASPIASAADAQFCFGTTVTFVNTSNASSPNSTQTYPQISNDLKFTCRTQGVQYTILDLAMRGFSITPMGDSVLKVTTAVSGSTVSITTQIRSQILIQK